MLRLIVFSLIVSICLGADTFAQNADDPTGSCQRIMEQDPTLNNLIDPQGYQTADPASLGLVIRVGEGTQPMILIPGLGFGGEVFQELMEPLAKDYRMYAVTLPGFGGSQALPCPDSAVSFGEQSWGTAALNAIKKLIRDEQLENPVIVGHWLTGTQLALRLALDDPENIKAVILLSGTACMTTSDPQRAVYLETLEKRVAAIDHFMAPQWFKTVTRETWDDNNFMPGDYAVHPVLGLRLWREAARPPLHVWVRYLCEFNAQDISQELASLQVPTLLLSPGLDGIAHDPDNNYMQSYCFDSWGDSIDKHPRIVHKVIPNSRICLWLDQPNTVQQVVAEFLSSSN